MLCGVESGQGQGGVSLINNHDDRQESSSVAQATHSASNKPKHDQ